MCHLAQKSTFYNNLRTHYKINMKKLFTGLCMSATMAAAMLTLPAQDANATGWPANYEGVMLQGFYWDSYKGSDTCKWTDLTNNADVLSKYFKLIWVPNCAKGNGENGGGNGYMPIYWFSHHSCAYGNETQLKTMISTFKEKGVGLIEDVVINHRVGVSDWADFPSETWNGVTYQLGASDVCNTDEWSGAKGAADTGEDFSGARDLDHTSSNVQKNCKAYCKYLLDELGFVGFRLDMAKGYSGYYTKIYNQYAKPTYSVGEYWDGSYDALAAWIEATGKESAAFDFAFKYAVNNCFNGNKDYSQLVWKANGTTDQPAGLIHFGYPQLAVTFIDNHDTYRDDNNKMTGDVLQANAFLLSCPGTPCVFWKHYSTYKTQIQAMIDARNGVGIHNCSAVTVLEVNSSCYVAEVTGTKGKLWIKLGSSSKTPGSGYTQKASGSGYEIWTTSSGGTTPVTPSTDPVNIYFKNTKSWTSPYIHYWGDSESTWPGVAMSKVSDTTNIYYYQCPAGTTGCLFNAGDGDATKTSDFSAVNNHLYTPDGDQGVYDGASTGGGGSGSTTVPAQMYLIGNIPSWDPSVGIAMTKSGNQFSCDAQIYEAGTTADPNPNGYFSFATELGDTWDDLNSFDRYGATDLDDPIAAGGSSAFQCFAVGVNASSAYSWMISPGNYTFTLDFDTMKLSVVNKISSVTDNLIDNADYGSAVWFNLQGQRVQSPSHGIFIRVVNGNAQKVAIK
jgi:hypothetical protein